MTISASRARRATSLDICMVSARPDGLSDLENFLREHGCRPIVTTPARLPTDEEWDAFDVVLLDLNDGGRPPEIPIGRANLVLATCARDRTDDPETLRAALNAGARDVLPRDPAHPRWQDLLRSAPARMPRAALRFVDPASQVERFFRLEKDTCTIGRDPASDLLFPQPFVSRLHARIVRAGKRFRIHDADSRLGTWVNDEKIVDHLLDEGDRIRIGGEQGPLLTYTTVTTSEGTMALEVGSALEGHTVNKEVRDIAALLESFLSLDSDLLLEEVLELLLDRMIELVGADRGVVLLRPWQEGPNGRLSVESLKLGTSRDKNGKSIPEDKLDINYRILGEVLRSGRGAVQEEFFAAERGGNVCRSSMCVPLKVRGKLVGDGVGPTVIGLLYIDSLTRGRPFSPRTLNTLEVLAAEAAMAVHTTRLYEDSLRRRRVEEEMAIAREIQRDIFRGKTFSDDVWELHGTTTPSHEVGGDFLSHFRISDDRIAVMLGDVSGKGVPAALFSTALDGLFHGLADLHDATPDLSAAAAKVNRFVLEKSRLRKFVTLVLGILGTEGVFHYVNSGHNPGLVVRQDGSIEELRTGGTILGMFDDAVFTASELRFAPGEFLVLYSDGITDATDGTTTRFGLERLEDSIRAVHEASRVVADGAVDASWLHGQVLDRFKRFVGGAPLKDDVTLMVVRRREGGARDVALGSA